MAAHRPMTPAEKYYTFLDQFSRINVMISADLDICIDPDVVLERWREFRTLRVLTRAVPTEDLTLVDLGPDVTLHGDLFRTVDVPADQWDLAFDEEAATPYDLGLPMRLRYLTSTAEGRSRVFIVGHHSMLDGRIGLAEVQAFVRFLDGQDVPEQQELSVPAPPSSGHAWQQDARSRMELLRAIRDRNVELGAPQPAVWPLAGSDAAAAAGGSGVMATPRLRQVLLDPDVAAGILARGRAHGSSAFSTVAAAWLATVAQHVCDAAADEPPTVQLTVPADASAPSEDPSRPAAMSVPVVSRPFRVDGSDVWGLAREVLGTIREALERGEGDLFFQLTRVGAVDDLADGAALVEAAIAAAPPCVVVSNMGVIDPGTDPEWLHHLQGQLSAAPNQMVFTATLSYRGRFVHTIHTDSARIPDALAARMTDSYLALITELSTDG